MTRTSSILAVILVIAAALVGWSATSGAQTAPVKLTWKIDTGGTPINLPPIIVAGKALVIPETKPLLAFDIQTGKEAWRYGPAEGVWDRSLSTDGERVFVCLKGGAIVALDAQTGAQLWKTDLGINCQRAAKVDGGMLYVPTTLVGLELTPTVFTGAKLFAINAKDGSVTWAFTSDNYFLQTPYVQGDAVYLGGNFEGDKDVEEGGFIRIYALDRNTAQVKWTYESEDGTPKALYATDTRVAYIGYQDFVVGLDTQNGQMLWRRDTGNWVPSLAGQGEIVYYGSATTKVYAWQMKDGTDHWMYDIPAGGFDYLMGAPVFEDGRMYFMSQKGTLYALDQNTGAQAWSHFIGEETRIGISVSAKTLYVGASDGTLSAYAVLR